MDGEGTTSEAIGERGDFRVRGSGLPGRGGRPSVFVVYLFHTFNSNIKLLKVAEVKITTNIGIVDALNIKCTSNGVQPKFLLR